MNIFRNRHADWLEHQLRDAEIRHASELQEMRLQHAREVDSLRLVYTELKNAHALETERAIQEIAKLRDDLDRVRLYLTPALQSVSTKVDDSAPPSPAIDSYAGTPWQRILAREVARQEQEEVNRKPVKPVPAENPEGGEVTN